MAFDKQAALAAGYTEEEIDAYLQNQNTAPPAPSTPVESVGEPPAPTTTVTPAGEDSYMPGLATAGLGLASAAVPLGIGIGIGKYGGRGVEVVKNLIQGAQNVPTPSSMPVMERPPTAAPQQMVRPVAPAAPAVNAMQGAQVAQQGDNWIARAMQMAGKYAPAMRAVGPAAMIGTGLAGMMYTSPEEIAILKQEEARKRAAGWKPINER